MQPLIGVDVGQRHEASGVCVVEESKRGDMHYLVRYLARIPAGSTLPQIVQRVSEISRGAKLQATRCPHIFVDLTGLGTPVLELMQSEIPEAYLYPVYFNHGDQMRQEYPDLRIGKAFLVSRLQLLLQTARLHLPSTPDARQLADELLSYQVKIEPDANDHYGAFAVGTRDELVTALGMAVSGANRHIAAEINAYYGVLREF